MKYTNIILTMIFALLLIDTINLSLIQDANASIDSDDVRSSAQSIVRALDDITNAIIKLKQ
jgi:hypothetical protein|tara:strand:- start:510 stop:692 length:183 start_codon:yes stop_codon:yes gene_type:complete